MFTVAVTSQFDFMSEEYATLFAESCATAFQHPVWLDSLYRKLVPRLKTEPLVVTVRDASDSRLMMVVPLLRRRQHRLRTIEFADLGVSDYISLVASESAIDAIAADPFTCKRIQSVLKPFDVMRIRKLRSSSTSVQKVLGATACTKLPMSAYGVPLGDDFAAWRTDNMVASYRKELDKKLRQLHRKGHVVFERATDLKTIETTMLKIQEYRQPRFESGDLLQDQIFFQFYLDVATRKDPTLARVYTMLMDGKCIAGAMSLSHKQSLLVIATGFDHDSYKSQSIGSLLFEMIAHHAISVGDRELDFTIGDEPYKTLFGAQKSPIYQTFGSGSIAGAVAGVAMQNAPWIKSITRRFVK